MSDKNHLTKPYNNILVSEVENKGALKTGLIQLNRPDVLNALNIDLMIEVVEALESFDKDPDIGCMVLTGNKKAFAAGADIKEMAEAGAIEMLLRDQFARWDRIRKIKKPVIAAVSGFALGGGCELAMSCDMIVASESARVRTAGNQSWRNSGSRGNSAPHKSNRQSPSNGNDTYGKNDGSSGNV
jgi:enoyl-CoA hydratase/carnithine racemase